MSNVHTTLDEKFRHGPHHIVVVWFNVKVKENKNHTWIHTKLKVNMAKDTKNPIQSEIQGCL
jgi:hypothetical protein